MSAALIMVPILRLWALKRQMVDVPCERKVHSEGIPRLGGIGIFAAFLIAIVSCAEMTPPIRGVLAGGLVIFLTGMMDDLHSLSPKGKLFGQISGVALAIAVSGIHISRLGDLFGAGELVLPVWAGIPFTIFAVVGVINAFNLIDGLDGLAGGIAVVALVTFFLLGMLDGNASVMALCAALLGAVVGFLKYNFHPARIFMGDAGSLVLGFALAFTAIILTQAPGSTVSPVIPVLVLGLPIIDTLRVMVCRIAQGANPFTPDKTHVHHKFLSLGFEHRFTVLVMHAISIFLAVFAVLFSGAPEYLPLLFLLTVSLFLYAALGNMQILSGTHFLQGLGVQDDLRQTNLSKD